MNTEHQPQQPPTRDDDNSQVAPESARAATLTTDSVFGEAMLDHLRAEGFDVTPRAEQ